MTEQQTPTPIDPADIRPGDVVRIVQEVEVRCAEVTQSGDVWLNETWTTQGAVVHLVRRPDPDAEVIEALAKAIHEDGFFTAWDEIDEDAREELRSRARAALAAIRKHDAKRADQ